MFKLILKKTLSGLKTLVIILVSAAILAVLMRVFLMASFKVPSCSMFPAVEPGDFIIANKQIPGPRVFRNIRQIRIDGKVAVKRFKGIRKIKRNDILVFNYPYSNPEKIDMDLNLVFLKRCVAVAGDTFRIKNGIYQVANAPSEVLGNREQQKQFSAELNDFKLYVFPYDTVHYKWTVNNFGPLYVPKTGDNLAIDTVNFVLYKNLIAYETNKPVTKRNGEILIGDSIISSYTFTLNYYFMAGDYVFDSQDSRYWGLLPEEHIIGKAAFVWKSIDPQTKKLRWGRVMKQLGITN
jgi:signal peptidase I